MKDHLMKQRILWKFATILAAAQQDILDQVRVRGDDSVEDE